MNDNNNNNKPEAVAVDVSDITSNAGSYICPNCSVFMLARRVVDLTEYVCPLCGITKNPLLDSMKHGSILTPARTEEQITDGEMHIFAVAEDESGFSSNESTTEPNEILEQDKAHDEMWRRKGFKVTTI